MKGEKTMKTIRDFQDADRYLYDFKVCTPKKGFAQVDTGQDAWYFGTWANPFKLQIVSYAEGDVTLQTAESVEEFVRAILSLRDWNEQSGHGFKGIDPMGSEKIEARFKEIGLVELLH